MLESNITNTSSEKLSPILTQETYIGWSTALCILALAIVIENTVSIIIFTRKQFKRKRSYYLVINMTVTDLLVGATAISSYLYCIQPSESDIFRKCTPYYFLDIMSSLASIFTITSISLERLFAIGWPLRHRLLKTRPYTITIISTWLCAGTIAGLYSLVYYHFRNLHRNTVTYITTVAIICPLIITIIAYIALWVMQKKSGKMNRRENDNLKDLQLARTLTVVTTVFVLMWLPFVLLSAVLSYSDQHVSYNVMRVTIFLHFSNSLVNPVIYTMRIPTFKAVLKAIFCSRIQQVNRNPANPTERIGKTPETNTVRASNPSAKTQLHERIRVTRL